MATAQQHPQTVTLSVSVTLSGGASLVAIYLADGDPLGVNMAFDPANNTWSADVNIIDLGDNGPFEHAFSCHIRGPKDASAKFSGQYTDSTGMRQTALNSNVTTRSVPNPNVYRDGLKTVWFEIK